LFKFRGSPRQIIVNSAADNQLKENQFYYSTIITYSVVLNFDLSISN